MNDQGKTREELLEEVSRLRQRIRALEAGTAGYGRTGERSDSGIIPPHEEAAEEDITESIDITTFLTHETTATGSFDIRGDIWATTFGKLMEALPTPTLLIDRSQRITAANHAWNRITPDPSRLVGMMFHDLFPSGAVATKARSLVESIFTDRKSSLAVTRLRVGAAAFWGRVTFRPIKIMNERLLFVLVEDLSREKKEIEERKQTERALRESERRYRELAELLPEFVYEIDLSGTILFVNRAGIAGTGHTREELSGDFPAVELFAPEDRKRVSAYLAKVLQGEDLGWYECTAVKKNGDRFPVMLCGSPIVRDDKVAGIRGIAVDITERKAAEEIRAQTERLTAAAELSKGVSHNFNNLLQIILGSAEMALRELDSGELSSARADLERICESCAEGNQVVKGLLDFVAAVCDDKLEGGDVFDLSHTVQQAVELARPWWEAGPAQKGRQIRLIANLLPGCVVEGNQAQLLEATVALIKNAAEALPDGGEIGVVTSRETGHVFLRVQDDGVGIRQEDRTHLFEPFWTTKRPQQVGMGLTRCLGIVRRHGGEISVDSEETKGSIFTVMLPMAAKPLEEKAPPLKATVDFELTILVVDDSEPIAKLLERVLTDHGQTVFTAISGPEAIRVFKEVHVDVVICDLVMPKMDGWEVAANIIEVCRRRGSEKPPFILLTAAGLARTEKEKLEQNRIDRVCRKPINVQELLKMIGEVTRMRPLPRHQGNAKS